MAEEVQLDYAYSDILANRRLLTEVGSGLISIWTILQKGPLMAENNNSKMKIGFTAVLMLVAFVAVTLIDGFTIISPGERGVVVRLGQVKVNTSLTEGFHFKLPWLDHIDRINVQIRKYEAASMDASSKDLQTVTTSCIVNYRVNPAKAAQIRQQLGLGEEVLEITALQPALSETIKAVTARYDATQLISQRAEVSTAMKDVFQKKLNTLISEAFIVSEFAITDFSFSKTFTDAIEAKVRANESAKRAENEVRESKAKAEQRIATARGEAESIRIRAQAEADAIKLRATAFRENPEVLQLNVVQKWDGKLPLVVGQGGEDGNIMLIGPMLEPNKAPQKQQ